jgi:acyl dehydratase
MAINPALVGRTYPPSAPYRVSREKIREFADAIGDPHPAYRDVDAARALGHPDVVAPPTFPIVLSLGDAGRAVVEDPELGLDYSRVVHGEQRFLYARPIVAGDILVATPQIAAIRSAAGNDMLTWDAVVTTTAGEHVCTATSLLVARAVGAGA